MGTLTSPWMDLHVIIAVAHLTCTFSAAAVVGGAEDMIMPPDGNGPKAAGI